MSGFPLPNSRAIVPYDGKNERPGTERYPGRSHLATSSGILARSKSEDPKVVVTQVDKQTTYTYTRTQSGYSCTLKEEVEITDKDCAQRYPDTNARHHPSSKNGASRIAEDQQRDLKRVPKDQKRHNASDVTRRTAISNSIRRGEGHDVEVAPRPLNSPAGRSEYDPPSQWTGRSRLHQPRQREQGRASARYSDSSRTLVNPENRRSSQAYPPSDVDTVLPEDSASQISPRRPSRRATVEPRNAGVDNLRPR